MSSSFPFLHLWQGYCLQLHWSGLLLTQCVRGVLRPGTSSGSSFGGKSFLYLLQVHGHTLRAIRSVHGLVMTSDVFHLVISNFWKLHFLTTFIKLLINFSNIFLPVQLLYIKWSHLKMCWATANPLQRGFFRRFFLSHFILRHSVLRLNRFPVYAWRYLLFLIFLSHHLSCLNVQSLLVSYSCCLTSAFFSFFSFSLLLLLYRSHRFQFFKANFES